MELTFASAADVEASRLSLMRCGFSLQASDTKLVATKIKPVARKLRRKKAPPPPEDDGDVDEDALLAADNLEIPEVKEGAACSARKE